jgi:ABC-type glycerol-3-phosphate transport system substrate-binding protein
MDRAENDMRKILGLLLAGCLLLTGCGDNGGRKNVSGDKNAEIVMWLIGSEGQALTIREISEEFYKDTGIKVRCDAMSWGDAHSKYLTSIAGGVAPDIGTIGLTWGAEFGDLGSMVDLREAYPAEIASMKESVFKGLWDSIEHNEKIYGIPFDMTEYVVYYRNDIVSKPPQTWDEMRNLLTDLAKSGKGMLFDWGSLSWIGYSPFLWQAGGDYYSKDYGEVTIDSPQAVSAMIFFTELYKKYNVPKTKIPLEQGMRTGDFPIAISGNWEIDSLRLLAPEISGKWSIATLPQGPNGKKTAFIGGRIMGIFSQSKHKDAAWKFLKYLFSQEAQTKLYEAALANQDTYLPPSIKTWDGLKMDVRFKSVLIEQANDAKGPPPVANWDSAAKYVDEAIQKIVLQNGDVKKELGIAKAYLQKYLKK